MFVHSKKQKNSENIKNYVGQLNSSSNARQISEAF